MWSRRANPRARRRSAPLAPCSACPLASRRTGPGRKAEPAAPAARRRWIPSLGGSSSLPAADSGNCVSSHLDESPLGALRLHRRVQTWPTGNTSHLLSTPRPYCPNSNISAPLSRRSGTILLGPWRFARAGLWRNSCGFWRNAVCCLRCDAALRLNPLRGRAEAAQAWSDSGAGPDERAWPGDQALVVGGAASALSPGLPLRGEKTAGVKCSG